MDPAAAAPGTVLEAPSTRTSAFLSGNEAIAQGAWEAGVRFATGYPGTPSTEILERLATMADVTAQWSVNEKVALECAAGASLAGARVLVTMKHVGLNVASDPLMTLGLTGVNGGLVIVSADDPGMGSSQNEQDNRNYARFAGCVMLEPSDSQECRDLARRAFALSEEWDLPVILRTTTPVNHGKGRVVSSGERDARELRPVPHDPVKWVMLPAYARRRRHEQLQRLAELEARGHELELHESDPGRGAVGIVAAGVCAQHVREALPDLPMLRLQLTHPLPWRAVAEFASRFERLLVVEELDPVLEEALRARGIAAVGRRFLPAEGPLDARLVRRAYDALAHERHGESAVPRGDAASGPCSDMVAASRDLPTPAGGAAALVSLCAEAPARPPILCPACPYRGPLRAFRKQEHFVFGDIGCSTLGALMPHEAIHFTLCMGASIGAAAGYSRVRDGKALAVIGDSTLLHSGLPSLLDVVYNRARVTIVVLDNCAIAMTGGQGHPGTGGTLDGGAGRGIDYEALLRSLGIRKVSTVDPYEGELFARTLERDMAMEEPTVIVARRACVLVDKGRTVSSAFVNPAMCTGCLTCLDEGCPALVMYQTKSSGPKVKIDPHLCVGCPDCSQSCAPGAISWFPDAFAGASR